MSIIKDYLKQNKVTHTFSSCQWPIGDPQEKNFSFCADCGELTLPPVEIDEKHQYCNGCDAPF